MKKSNLTEKIMKSAYELERDANIERNHEKLKELGPTALREYVSEVMAPPPPASYSSSLSSSSFAASGASTTGAGVGFDPRGM